MLLAALLLTFALDWFSLQLPPVEPQDSRDRPRGISRQSVFAARRGRQDGGSNGALWTLSLEVQFYAIHPLLFALRPAHAHDVGARDSRRGQGRVGLCARAARHSVLHVILVFVDARRMDRRREGAQRVANAFVAWALRARGGLHRARLRGVAFRSVRCVPVVGRSASRSICTRRWNPTTAINGQRQRPRRLGPAAAVALRRLQLLAVSDSSADLRAAFVAAVPLVVADVDLAVVRVHARRGACRVCVLSSRRIAGDEVVGQFQTEAKSASVTFLIKKTEQGRRVRR